MHGTPQNISQLTQFLALTGCYRNSINQYAGITPMLMWLFEKAQTLHIDRTTSKSLQRTSSISAKTTNFVLPISKQTILHFNRCINMLLESNTVPIYIQIWQFTLPQTCNFLFWQIFRNTMHYTAPDREAFTRYMSVKILSFYLQDAECIILSNHKPLEIP